MPIEHENLVTNQRQPETERRATQILAQARFIYPPTHQKRKDLLLYVAIKLGARDIRKLETSRTENSET